MYAYCWCRSFKCESKRMKTKKKKKIFCERHWFSVRCIEYPCCWLLSIDCIFLSFFLAFYALDLSERLKRSVHVDLTLTFCTWWINDITKKTMKFSWDRFYGLFGIRCSIKLTITSLANVYIHTQNASPHNNGVNEEWKMECTKSFQPFLSSFKFKLDY